MGLIHARAVASITAYNRLREYREKFAGVFTMAARIRELKKRAGTWTQWQEIARGDIRAAGFYGPWQGDSCRWVEDTARAGLRWGGFVLPRGERRERQGGDTPLTDDESRACGWYGDDWGDSIHRPVVYRLPRGRFAYGYACPDNPGAAYLCFEFCDSENDAEKWACKMAKEAAENAWRDAEEYREEEE